MFNQQFYQLARSFVRIRKDSCRYEKVYRVKDNEKKFSHLWGYYIHSL